MDELGLGALVAVCGVAGLMVTGSAGGAGGGLTAEVIESLCTTVPADCIATRRGATTGVEAAGSVSTVDRAIAVSRVDSVWATTVESRGPTLAVSGRANTIFLPNDSAFG